MAKIITEGWPEDDEVLLSDTSMTYIQNPDCTENRDGDPQELIISTRNNGIDNFLHIKTNGWSLDDCKDLTDIIEDFKKRINYGK